MGVSPDKNTVGRGQSIRLVSLYTGLGLAFTPVAMFCAIWSGGAGHGDYVVFRLLYPHLLLFQSCINEYRFGFSNSAFCAGVFLTWMGIQFPCYGLLIGNAPAMGIRRSSMWLVLALLHGAAAALSFGGLIPGFSYAK
jgi:hypothetical protein